jgi:hypothetical protein
MRITVDSRFEFTPGRPVTYYRLDYQPGADHEWQSVLFEHAGPAPVIQGLLWDACRASWARKRGVVS